MEYLFYAIFLVIGWVLAKIDSVKRVQKLVLYAYNRGAEDLIKLAKEEQGKSVKMGFHINVPNNLNARGNDND